MASWRMAMRGRIRPVTGKWIDPPIEMWELCRDRAVAAITYEPVQDEDFAQYSESNLPHEWARLAPAQKANLRRFVWEMQVGDVIYVKAGPRIVGRGTVASGYQFDTTRSIRNAEGAVWRHQRRVNWHSDFRVVTITIGHPQIATIVPLDRDDVCRVEATQDD